MLDDIGRRGDGRVIARGVETCHGDDGAVSSTTYWIVLLCFVLFSVENIIVTYVCALLKSPTRGVCDSYCNCTPIVVNEICLKQTINNFVRPMETSVVDVDGIDIL